MRDKKQQKMYYITYDNRDRAGAGAQAQRILSLFLLAKTFGLGYVHTGFITQEHEFDEQVLARFNGLMELSCYNKTEFDEIIPVPHFTQDVLSLVQNNPAENKDILLVISGAHEFLDHNPSPLEGLFPVKFSWVSDSLNPETQIAFHIRRGYDVTTTINADRFVEAAVYFDYIRELRKILTKPYTIHLFSKKEILDELQDIKVENDIVLHIEDDVVETFQFLVNCDLLFAGKSSFSYSAAMLRRKGIVLYTPFWHSYPSKHICLTHPNDIHTHKEKILHHL